MGKSKTKDLKKTLEKLGKGDRKEILKFLGDLRQKDEERRRRTVENRLDAALEDVKALDIPEWWLEGKEVQLQATIPVMMYWVWSDDESRDIEAQCRPDTGAIPYGVIETPYLNDVRKILDQVEEVAKKHGVGIHQLIDRMDGMEEVQ